MTECTDHQPFIVTYSRSWRPPWRKTFYARCMYCDDRGPGFSTLEAAQEVVASRWKRRWAGVLAQVERERASLHDPSGTGWPVTVDLDDPARDICPECKRYTGHHPTCPTRSQV